MVGHSWRHSGDLYTCWWILVGLTAAYNDAGIVLVLRETTVQPGEVVDDSLDLCVLCLEVWYRGLREACMSNVVYVGLRFISFNSAIINLQSPIYVRQSRRCRPSSPCLARSG